MDATTEQDAAAHAKRLEAAVARWKTDPPLAAALPLRFPSGSVLEQLECRCATCDQPIKPANLRGRMARQTPDVATVEALGACFDCRMLTPFAFRVRGTRTLRLEWRDSEGGWLAADTDPAEGAVTRGLRRLRRLVSGRAQPPSAGLRAALAAAQRPCFIPGMEGWVPDPIAQDALASAWIAALDAELAGRGVRNLRPLAGGASSVVLEADGGVVLRLGRGAVRERPAIPEMLAALAAGDMGDLRWELVPRAETHHITEADVAAMTEALAAHGYVFADPGTDNLGRFNGRLVVLDPGAVAPAPAPAPRRP